MDPIIGNIKKQLKENADAKTKASGTHFFKEKITLYGVKSATVSKVSKDAFKVIQDSTKHEIFNLCEILWESGYLEESFIACNWSYNVHKFYEPQDIDIFEKWIEKYITNWASCDTFCNHTIGEFIEMYPKYISTLKKWAKSSNRWMKRASAVSLIIPAKKGNFLPDIFLIADILLLDEDDMVQKGYGWMLKAASEARQKDVFNYVIINKKVMPRTALRYAIEKMPKELKDQAMSK